MPPVQPRPNYRPETHYHSRETSEFPQEMGQPQRSLTLLQKLIPYGIALRPRQWTKNLIVFAAPLFGLQLDLPSLWSCGVALALFCGLSSSFYLFNDLLDVKADRQHPIKCKRPIAAGLVAIPTAWAIAFGLLITTLTVAWNQDFKLGLALSSYGGLQVAYNLKLKRTVIWDVLAIAAGFVLRAYAGAAATHIGLSPWFLLCTGMLALFLAIEKRKAELRLCTLKGHSHRSVLHRYSQPLLQRMEHLVSSGAVMAYALWSSGPGVNGACTRWMLLTLPWVMYGVFRYQLLSDPDEIERRQAWVQYTNPDAGGLTERPEEVLLSDRPILLTLMGWTVTTLGVLLLHQKGFVS